MLDVERRVKLNRDRSETIPDLTQRVPSKSLLPSEVVQFLGLSFSTHYERNTLPLGGCAVLNTSEFAVTAFHPPAGSLTNRWESS